MHSSITAERVIQAIQNDDNTGFCRECGAEAQGVEPDATGYECEECGMMAVSGAEEFIFELVG